MAEGSSKTPKHAKRKQPVPAASPTWPKTKEEFMEWFWNGSNGNLLIKDLNASTYRSTDFIRRESLAIRPVVYCIVLNDGKFPYKEGHTQWKLCKVGFTHGNTKERTGNRMEQVKADIKRKYHKKTARDADTAVIFKLAIGAIDTTPYFDTEERIRKAMGCPLKKELAKKLGLPYSTEWVLTTQDFIDEVQKRKLNAKLKGGNDAIDLFKDLKFSFKASSKWVKVESDAKGNKMVVEFEKTMS